eukprot:6954237-Prorocentrum_lima.AAC.1
MEALPLQWARVAEIGVGESSPSCFESTAKPHTEVPTVSAVEVSYPKNMIIATKVFFMRLRI